MRASRTSITYRIMMIFSFVLFIIFFIYHIISTFMPELFGMFRVPVYIVSLILSVVFLIGTIFSFKSLQDNKLFFNQLKIKNKYIFGHETGFYDLSALEKRCELTLRMRKMSKKKQFIITFTVSSIKIAQNPFHNDQIMRLNYLVAKYLNDIFYEGKIELNHKNTIFGFDHGVFILYCFIDDENIILNIVDLIMNKIYQITEENKLKIWSQPFFGVKKIDVNDTFTQAVEDALLARNASENNFESYTYFDNKLAVIDANDNQDDIQKALENDEFIPYYQLKYSVKEKRFISAEALARWNHPTRGILSPSSFIEKAEKAGLLSTIDLIIFEKALKDLSDAHKKGRRLLPVSCNFSLYEFFSHNFLTTIVNLLKKYQVPPQLVEIEVTETTSQVNKFLSISVIKKLKDLGIRVLMDDFGVGYSGIENLKNIPFDAIKIDKSFSDEILNDEKTRSIVQFLINLGHLNDIEVIIEGVESKEQYEVLKKMKIDTIQGFYFAKPLSYSDMENYLKNNEFERSKK